MSNVMALANTSLVTAAKPQESPFGKPLTTKKESARGSLRRTEGLEEVPSTIKENADSVLQAKNQRKGDFTNILQKRLTDNTSGGKSGTPQSQKDGKITAVFSDEKPKSDDKAKRDTTVPVLSGVWFSPQSLVGIPKKQVSSIAADSKSAGNRPAKAAQTTQQTATQAVVASRQNSVAATNIATKTTTPTDSQDTAASSKKVVKDTMGIKDTLIAGQITNRPTNPVSVATVNNMGQQLANPQKTPNVSVATVNNTGQQLANPQKTPNVSVATVNNTGQQPANPQKTPNVSVNLPTGPNTAVAAAITKESSAAAVIKESSATLQAQVPPSPGKDQGKAKQGIIAELNPQAKSPISQAKESSVVLQTIGTDPTQPIVRQTDSIRSDAESPVQAAVSPSVGAEKISFQQAFLKPSEQIIDQIQTTLTGRVQQIQVTLSPAELGTVRITFRQQDGQMEGLLEVQNSQVRKDVEKALPQIAAALAQNGIEVRRMDIASMPNQQQSGQDSFQSPAHNFSAADQHYLAGQSGSSSSKGADSMGISQQAAEQADSPQGATRQVFDPANLNMYA